MKKEMMSLDEIENCKNINENIVKEALDQVKERLRDLRDSKNNIEQKAFLLFNGSILLLVAEVSGANIVRNTYPDAFVALKIMIPCLIIGVFLLALSMVGYKLGAFGSEPKSWLQEGTINGKNLHLKVLLAYQVFQFKNKIELTEKSNFLKVRLIQLAIILNLIGVIVATFWVYC